MFNETVETRQSEQFEHLLALSIPSSEAPEAWRADLHLAEKLREINLGSESQVKAQLRAQLQAQLRQKRQPALAGRGQSRPIHRHVPRFAHRRVWLGAILGVLLFFALVSNTPARAALGCLFGYGYLPYAGFVPLSNTKMIAGPVTQSAQGWTVTVLQGVQDRQRTALWIGTNLDLSELLAAELVLPDQARLPVRAVQPHADSVVLIFDKLPDQADPTTLALPGGWQLPFHWINCDQAGLAPTQVNVPFQTITPFGSQSEPPCSDLGQDVQICAQAAFTDAEGTHLLLQARQGGKSTPLAVNDTPLWKSIALEDQAGRTYPIRRYEASQDQDPSILSVLFSTVPSEVKIVTLHLPVQALEAAGSLSWPSLVVDLPLRLPDHVPARSPTPGMVPTVPGHPITVPTPGASSASSSTAQP